MKLPKHPEYLETEKIIMDGVTHPLIKLEVLPGKMSETKLLNFTWSLVEYSETQLQIKLEFEN